MSNGYLQMLMNAGYIPEFKGTRSAKKTIKNNIIGNGILFVLKIIVIINESKIKKD